MLRTTPPWSAARIRTLVVWILLLALLVVGIVETGVTPAKLFGSLGAVGDLLSRMFPPSLVDWERYVAVLGETLFMVIAGTALALILTIPCAILGARNTTTGRIGYGLSRAVIVFTRSIPTLLLALVFVRGIGIGPMAGVLAIGVHSIGMLAKFFADAIEDVDDGPVQAMRATGAGPARVFVSAILPQVVSNWSSLLLYRLDINMRGAVILGYVGAGGIGLELQRALGQLAYRRALTIVIIMFVLILLTEYVSAVIRRRLLGSEPDRRPGGNPFSLRSRWRAWSAKREEGRLSSPGETGSRREHPAQRVKRQKSIRAPWTGDRIAMWTAAVGGIAISIVSFAALGLTPERFGRLVDLPPFLLQMVPPDFVTNLPVVLGYLLETFWIALTATAFGVIMSIPLAIFGARNATPRPFLHKISRGIMLIERGIPELVIAVVLVVAVGLGPFAGVVALSIGAFGMTGKLIADAIESRPLRGVHEALDATGATWLQRTISGTLPESMPNVISVSLYTMDVNIRSAATLGIVGAGGIGVVLFTTTASRQFDRMLAIILLIFAVVLIVEQLSGWLRKRLT